LVLRRRSWQCCRQITQVHRLPALLSCRHCSAAVQSGHRACEFNGCKKIPVFGRQPGGPCAAFLCRTSTSPSSTSREFDGCNTRPHFGSATDRVMHCGAHKEEGHVDAKSKMCELDGCLTVPHCVSRYVSSSCGAWSPGCGGLGPRPAAQQVAMYPVYRGQEYTSREMLRAMARARQ
jgi:hypothetical protein